jgi:threonine dehydrogenase-like Zn-dependent dehydrogenase
VVAVIGVGFIGAAVARLAARRGRRWSPSRGAESLDLAREMGAAHAIPMHDHWGDHRGGAAPHRRARGDVVVEAAGRNGR